ncbi:MAG: endo-1,4-beta-xylanase [Steroidobacteraceae bacterium]
MFQRARSLSCLAVRRRMLAIAAAAVVLLLTCLRPASAQVDVQYTWADGQTDGWTSFYNASAPVVTTAAASVAAQPDGGDHSLLTTTNSTGNGGPAVALTGLIPGATYSITGYVMLTGGETATDANFTVQSQDPNCTGGTCYTTVGNYQVPVTDTAWAEIGGNYTVSTTATSLLLYAQLIGPTAPESFYLADVTITEVSGPPGTQSNLTTTFEDGGLDGWSSRSGSSVLTNAAISNGPNGDTNVLLVANRQADWDGPQINVSNYMYTGSDYSISVWVMLGPNATQADSLNVSLQVSNSGTPSYYTVVNDTPVPLGQWVQLTIPRFTMAYSYDPGSAYLYVQSASGTQDFYITDFQLTYLPPLVIQQNIPSIYQTLAQYFPVGAAVDQTDLSGPHEQLLVKHFDSITSENDMKWQETEPEEGDYTYTVADQEVALAQANSMRIRGQNLVWSTGEQVPSWVFLEADGTTPLSASNPADVQLLTERIQSHIQNEVQHFGTAVYAWDVVNEPLDPTQPDCLEHGPFYQVLGPRYIDIALAAAREYTPPGTQLFINEYSLTDPSRLQCMIRLIQHLRRHGVPVDGIGHEMHTHIDYPTAFEVYSSFDLLHRLFPWLKQQVTELDMSVYLSTDNTSNYGANGGTVPQSLIAEQGWLYKDYFDVFKALASRGELAAVTFWGMADDDTWLDSFPINRLDAPLPFDQLLQAKPAYWGIVDPTQLPGYGMTLALTGQSGPPQSQTWTITATNPSQAIAYNAKINGLYLLQVRGRPCWATITPPSKYPVPLGNVGAGGTASASFTAQFQHCADDAQFVLWGPWSANVYQTGTLVAKGLQP